MFRLVDGACAVLRPPGFADRVAWIDGSRRVDVPEALRATLARTAQGLALDDEANTDDGRALIELGVAAPDLSADDAHVMRALKILGDRIRWRVSDAVHDELLLMARRIHARRKFFVEAWGQTSCLPESVVARVTLAARRLQKGARVLLIGDDDFLSTPLASLGFDVTVCDIDPDLIRFLNVVAGENGVKISTRNQDLLLPLPAEWVGAFDAVLTDPMSHENCLSVFLGRGLAALKPGGLLMSALHPLARDVMKRVLSTLPCHVEAYDQQVAGYYITAYMDVDYVSDYVTMRRTDGALPVAADEPMPAIDVTVETLPTPPHGYTRVIGMRLGTTPLTVSTFEALLRAASVPMKSFEAREHGKFLHAHVTFFDGHSVVIVIDKRRFTAMVHTYPYDEAQVSPLITVIEAALRRQGRDHFYPYADQTFAQSVLTRTTSPR